MILKKKKKIHLRVKLVSYEKNKPEVLSAMFSSAENSDSIFFCQRNDYVPSIELEATQIRDKKWGK